MSSLMRLAVLKRSVECNKQDNLLLLLINLLPKEVCLVQEPGQFLLLQIKLLEDG